MFKFSVSDKSLSKTLYLLAIFVIFLNAFKIMRVCVGEISRFYTRMQVYGIVL